MPVTKSAKKALKVDKRKKLENDLVRAKIKSAIKGAKISIAKHENDIAEKLKTMFKELDIAAKKNVIHKNKAARLKSRISKLADKSANTKTESAKKVSKKTATKN